MHTPQPIAHILSIASARWLITRPHVAVKSLVVVCLAAVLVIAVPLAAIEPAKGRNSGDTPHMPRDRRGELDGVRKDAYYSLATGDIWDRGSFGPSYLSFADGLADWMLIGSNVDSEYVAAADRHGGPKGRPIASVASKIANPSHAAVLVYRYCDDYVRGRRFRLSAMLKGERVAGEASFCLRVDSVNDTKIFAAPLTRSTGWQRYSFVFDVPANSSAMEFGALLSGSGKVSIADVNLEAGNGAPLTSAYETVRRRPRIVTSYPDIYADKYWTKDAHLSPTNLSFTSGLSGWKTGSIEKTFLPRWDQHAGPHGLPAITMKTTRREPRGNTGLQQNIWADLYRGKRVRISADVKYKRVTGTATMDLMIYSAENSPFRFSYHSNTIDSTATWTRQSIVMDVPENGLGISIGADMNGAGTLSVANVKFETVGTDVPVSSLDNEE